MSFNEKCWQREEMGNEWEKEGKAHSWSWAVFLINEKEQGGKGRRVGQSLPSEWEEHLTFTLSFLTIPFIQSSNVLSILAYPSTLHHCSFHCIRQKSTEEGQIWCVSQGSSNSYFSTVLYTSHHQHPISRRVLRFERSVDQFDNNRIDEELGLPFDFPSFDTHAVESKDTSSTNQFVYDYSITTHIAVIIFSEVRRISSLCLHPSMNKMSKRLISNLIYWNIISNNLFTLINLSVHIAQK